MDPDLNARPLGRAPQTYRGMIRCRDFLRVFTFGIAHFWLLAVPKCFVGVRSATRNLKRQAHCMTIGTSCKTQVETPVQRKAAFAVNSTAKGIGQRNQTASTLSSTS